MSEKHCGDIIANRGESIDVIAEDAIKPTSSKDLDETYDVYRQQDAREVDPDEAKRVLRKIDLHIMPLLMGTYMLQYLDKASINFASVFGLIEDNHLSGNQYSWYVPSGCTCRALSSLIVGAG
jgi:hypothetical protein